MTGLSGISGEVIQRKGKKRYLVHWRCRLFMEDKVIHNALITSVFKEGYGLQFINAVPVGSVVNVEFGLSFHDKPYRIRFKAKVDYCMLRSQGDGADLDLVTMKIGREDQHTLNNILQELEESKEFTLRM